MINWILILELGLIATIFAGLPLVYLWSRPKYDFFQKLNWLLVFITFDLIVFGAFTRLTDSGLGCPDWPGCYGTSNPWQASGEIQAAETSLPTGPVTLLKAWIEMVHRYLAMTVGALIVTQVFMSLRQINLIGKRPLLGSLLLFILVSLQGAFGAWTVTLRLQPIIVTMHLIFALVLLASLTAFAQQAYSNIGDQSPMLRNRPLSAKLLIFGSFVLAMQIFLGAWVSTNYAVLSCPNFPKCLDSLWPVTDWVNGFALWRELGRNTLGDFISPEALQTIHWAHRVFSIVALAFLSFIAWQGIYLGRLLSPGLLYWSRILLSLALIQIFTGIANIVFQWPLFVAVMHTGGAALLVICMVRISYWASWQSPVQIKAMALT